MMTVFTIGYAQKSAMELFQTLKRHGVRKVIDIRLKNANSYCFYTHKRDFPYLLSLAGIQYEHKEVWAPTAALLDGYKKGEISWPEYEIEYRAILERRDAIRWVKGNELDHGVLLCTEPTPEKCHRRLLAEYFKKRISDLEIVHI